MGVLTVSGDDVIKEERVAAAIVGGSSGGRWWLCYSLEKRGYVKVGVWTPQCTVLHPEAGASALVAGKVRFNLHFTYTISTLATFLVY